MDDHKWETLFTLLSEAMKPESGETWKEARQRFLDEASTWGALSELDELASWMED